MMIPLLYPLARTLTFWMIITCQQCTQAFMVRPKATVVRLRHSPGVHFSSGVGGDVPVEALSGFISMPSSLFVADDATNITPNSPSYMDAFTDEIIWNPIQEPTLRTMFAVFGVVIIGLVVANILFRQMDSAIEKVLLEFEQSLRSKYPSRWYEVEAELEGLNGTERSQKLLEVMERMQAKDPGFMNKLKRDAES